MPTGGERMCILAEIIRVATRGATREDISSQLSLSEFQTMRYLRFLQNKHMLLRVKGPGTYTPTPRGVSFLSIYDDMAEMVEVESDSLNSGGNSRGSPHGVYWEKSEISARMREIIDR